MAEPADAGKPARPGGIGKKLGPLPIWAWAIIAAAAGYIWWKYFGPGKTAAATTATTATGAATGPRGWTGARGQTGKTGKKGSPAPAPKRVDVPDVRGQEYIKAGREIKNDGLIAQRSAPYVGTVRSESPAAGSKVEKGTVVTLRGKPWKTPGGGTPKGATAHAGAPAMASAGQVVTPQSTAFQAWDDDSGDAAPAYAPMTAGSIHG